jgi:hypothetical protein
VIAVLGTAGLVIFKGAASRSEVLHVDSDFDHWIQRSESSVRVESRRRLGFLHKAAMLYSYDHDSRLPYVDSWSDRSYELKLALGQAEKDSDEWYSPLCPPEDRPKLSVGFLWYEPLDSHKQNMFSGGLTRREMYDADPEKYPILVDRFISMFHGQVGERVVAEVLHLDGTVNTVKLETTVDVAGDHYRSERGKL